MVLTLQNAVLRSLIANGAMTPVQALDAIDKALAASLSKASTKEEQDVALVTVQALAEVLERLADMVN